MKPGPTMKMKLITLAYDTQVGAFPSDPLAEIEGEILNVVEHFFYDGGQPRLLLIVHYRPAVFSRGTEAQPPGGGLQQREGVVAGHFHFSGSPS